MVNRSPAHRTGLPQRRVRPRRAHAFLAAGTVLVLAGCGAGSASDTSDTAANTTTADLFAPVGHVHGVGVDPAGGSVVVAGHYGLFALAPDGTLVPRQDPPETAGPDLMGFTVAGPRTFLASGHPAPDDAGTPNPVGLVRSTDAGTTWEPVSLQGQVDFHSLDAAGTSVVGLDATRGLLMVSSDGGRTWQERAALDALDIAVDPSDGTRVLATTENGVAASQDGGSTFRSVTGSPLLAFVSWAGDGAVYGIGPDGTVHASTDRGATWQRRAGTESPPQAITAEPGGRLTIVTNDGIHRSTDGGATLARIA
ncbi:F510_1955 family glycosylhydrolase [Pseudonocardia alni]|jgi:hypothetical protein|uniref:F510_1955 family glycosylhydrolase n=1 Tax=Pseudonocardia TaxID=1847 RepID=UPI0024789A47|nr:exo-alpha-sialidase [Pseudonocardia alni]